MTTVDALSTNGNVQSERLKPEHWRAAASGVKVTPTQVTRIRERARDHWSGASTDQLIHDPRDGSA